MYFICFSVVVILGAATVNVRGLAEAKWLNGAPFLFLFGAAIKLSGREGVASEARIPGGRPAIVAAALMGIATTVASMAISFVPPPDEEHPLLAVAKIGGLTSVLLLGGAALYAAGSIRARRQFALDQMLTR